VLIATGPDKFSVVTYLSQYAPYFFLYAYFAMSNYHVRFFHHFKGATSEPQININATDPKHDDEAIRKRKEQMEADLKKRSKKCSKCSEPLSGMLELHFMYGSLKQF
jgi:hypothetical protein